MTTDEPARLRRLFQRLGEVFGRDDAELLMAYLPPGGWADIRTHQAALHRGLEALGARVDQRFDEVAEHAAEQRQHTRLIDHQLIHLDLRFDDATDRVARSEHRLVVTLDDVRHHVEGTITHSGHSLITTLVWAHVAQLVALLVIAALLVTRT